MNNKTSDENVGNKIKQQTENTIKYYKNIDNIEEVPIDILRAMYKDILSDYTRQKQINEEHQKINGELREQVKELECENNEMKSLFEIQASIAKELEFSEKDKMIKFRGNFYIPDTMTLNSEIGKEKRIELSYVDVSRLLENRIVKS